ncbi:MAG TPA: YcxB family protein [Thermoanaerobaculia bacterium]|nr:YcxB family protein [Thermoanaerobaculia bacterium]
MIHFGGELQEAEFRRAQWFLSLRMLTWIGLVVLGAFLLWAVADGLGGIVRKPVLTIALLVYAAFVIIAPRRAVTKAWRNTPLLHQRVDGEISEDGVTWKTPSSDIRLSWDKFIGHRGRSDMLLIYTSPKAALIMPRSYFVNDSDWAAANEIAARKVKAR